MKKIMFAILILAFGGVILAQPAKPATVRSQMLVTTGWLSKNLNNPKLVLLCVGRERKDYDAGHIPGARFLALSEIVSTVNGMPNEIPALEKLQAAFAKVGVNNDSRIILYGENYNLFAARAFFTLDYLGFGAQTALLDGGLDKWKLDKLPLETAAPQITAGNFTAKLNPAVLAVRATVGDISWTIANNSNTNYALLDARPKDEYTGAKPGDGVKRGGHIPGAASVFWMDNHLVSKDNPVLRSVSELQKIYAGAGATKGKKIVSYCRTGVQASHTYFVAKYLGYDVSMYDGSFLEWSNADKTPVVAGENAK